MTTPKDQIYVPSGAAEIRDDILTDIRLEGRQQDDVDTDELDRAVLPGGDWHILATSIANIGLIQYSNLRIQDDNADVLKATGKALDDKRDGYGLPEVPASAASGKIEVEVTSGSPTLPDQTEFTLPNGLRGVVDGLHFGLSDGDEVAVYTLDKGIDTNLAAGEEVSFVSPPSGIATEAVVSASDPLTGGLDAETDERKRARILNRLRSVPAGGNWGHKIETALNNLATVQYAFSYPALGGPGSEKLVIMRALDPDNDVLTREFSTSAVAVVREAIHAEFGSPFEIVVQSVADETTDVAIKITIPDAASAGGNGLGWIDNTPWPPLGGGDTYIAVSAVTSSSVFAVVVNAATAPVNGQTHIAWWSPADQKFYTALIVSHVDASPTYTITLDQGLVDSTGTSPAVGDYISPVAVSTEAYGQTWVLAQNALGPGENTADANRLPRAKRHPFVEEDWPSSLTAIQLTALTNAHSEITDLDWSYRSVSAPTTPGAVTTAPNILVCNHFGIYEQ
jgi:hypothetical protein